MKLPAIYGEARRAVAAAVRIDEAKSIHDKSLAMAVYAFQAKDSELVASATEIKRRATRRIGELMQDQRKAGKLAKGGQPHQRRGKATGTPKNPVGKSLADQGIDKHLADAARKLAAMPEEKFERETAKAVDVAVAAVTGAKEIVKAARAKQQAEKKTRRSERERELGAKITALPDRRYGVIVADPEWKDTVWSEDTGMDRHASNHYPTSDVAVIASRPVEKIAAKDCVLLLWSTNQHLRIAIGVMEAWGFEYKSNYCWGKDKISTGRWNRSKHELLLVGTCGKPVCPAPGEQWDSLIMAPRGKHSEKPECFLEMIEQYFPNIPKIELNRRGPPRPGWDAWGLEAVAAE